MVFDCSNGITVIIHLKFIYIIENLMDKSVTIWKVPVPKLTTVTIPKLKLKSNTLTWGQISSTKQEVSNE
jgi:hypothetical protein